MSKAVLNLKLQIKSKVENLELNNLKQVSNWMVFCLLTGVLAALMAIGLDLMVDRGEKLFFSHHWLLFFAPIGSILIVHIYRSLKVPFNLNTSTVVGSARRGRTVPFMLAPAIMLGTTITNLIGGSAGKEAAALQLGGALGSGLGAKLGLKCKYDGLFIIAGMAAAFSALVYAPLTACIFAIEVTRTRFSNFRPYIIVALSSYIAYGIARIFQIGYIWLPIDVKFVTVNFGATVMIGIFVALTSIVFCLLLRGLRLARAVHLMSDTVSALIGALILVAFIWFFDLYEYSGTGASLIGRALSEGVTSSDFAWKALITLVTLGFGLKGGEVMPIFAIGACVGSAFAFFLDGADAGVFACIGLIAMFACCTDSPIAAIMLSAEAFGISSVPIVLPAVLIAYFLTRRISLYDTPGFWLVKKM